MRIRPYCILIIFCFLHFNFLYAGDKETNKKDTVSAIVVDDSNPLFSDISNLSGKQIINMIDSLLELDEIPKELIKSLNDYAEDKLLKHDYFVSLTYYYEDSEIPSNSVYQSWNTKEIYPYDENITKDDSILELALVDEKNFCNYVPPLKNPVITSNFGWRDGKNHNGIDLDLEVWDPVHAAFDGMVRVAMFHPGYGRVVVIRHYNGLETLYAHLHRIKVKPGDIVEAGQVVGLGGSSGNSTGSHLHFEVRFKGKPLNPKNIISFKENKLISDTLILKKNKWSYAALPKGIKYHTIEKGDFLYKIANRYGISVRELCELNQISRNKTLIVGRKLRIE